jgi:acyl-CoA thioesterase-1
MRILRILAFIALGVFTSSAYSATKTVLVLGDSLSAEHGIARGTGWVALMQDKLNAEKVDVTLVNASISGETTSGGKARLPALLQKYRPYLVIIELGANDGLRGLPVAETRENLQTLIKTAQNAQAKVLLTGIKLPPNYGVDYSNRFFAIFSEQAKITHSALVPFMLEGVADKPE